MTGSKIANRLQALVVLLLYVFDVVMVVACAFVHLTHGGTSNCFGGFTIAIFCVGGFFTNWFNFYRHEKPRMEQRQWPKKIQKVLFLFIPSQAFLVWTWEWWKNPLSWTANYWVATLRLFYTTTGSLLQATLQTYIIIDLWWDLEVAYEDICVMMAAAVFLALHSVLGVCIFVWKETYEEEHEVPRTRDFVFIVISVSLNMCGRIVSMAMVAAVINWGWMIGGLAAPFFLNYALCLYTTFPLSEGSFGQLVARCTLPIPTALLFALSVSKDKVATVLTTICWLCFSLPQIVTHHDTAIHWLVWGVPFLGQLVAFVLMMIKWSIFQTAFTRFGRLLEVNKETTNRTKEEV
ncbi:uncharacterized protein LOC121873310 [Homarus americanus]|uniref:Transmembrane protein n=1 Tax=Homarus americanus TaxID=6706 RepID=A0A8J5JS48_HOMAM|nr:uncharacterized protein LOC121873310 [Homarus americanus]KAG7163170.1 hypothetical protein Hamer_G002246 [Homarus americanus]